MFGFRADGRVRARRGRFARAADAEASALRDALERAAVCASTDETRPILTAVALFIEEGPPTLQVVPTDS